MFGFCFLPAIRVFFTSAAKNDGDIKPEDLTARAVMHNPDEYLKVFITHWSDDDNSPCVDGKILAVESLQYWKDESNSKNVKKLAEHRFLPGLCRTYANNSFDFCMSRGMVPVLFDSPHDPEKTVDMVRPFTTAFWCCYCNMKEDESGLESDECQTVIHI